MEVDQFPVAKRLPRSVHDDSVLYVNHVLAHRASILLMLLPLPNFIADPQELDQLPGSLCLCENRASAYGSVCRT